MGIFAWLKTPKTNVDLLDEVTRRIQAAAQKIQSQAISNMPADSAEEWLERNCLDLWRNVQR